MLNEAPYLRGVVASLAAQDFEGEVELLVADGGSTDGSSELLRAEAERAGIALTVIDNPRRIVAPGLNECIRRASGDLIVRIDCHSRYPSDYLSRCARAAEETGAWNVGGIFRAEGTTPTERAVAAAMDSPFGGVNWTRDANGDGLVETDTVYCGAFRPEAFERAGLFDETLARNQDDELNLRIRRAGGRIVLDPKIRAQYTPRGSYRKLFRQYYEYGRWKVPVMLKHRQVSTARSLAPMAFVASLVVLCAAAPASGTAKRALTIELGIYATAASFAAVVALNGRRESWGLFPRVVAVFPTLHVGYGLGMSVGWLAAALRV
jgi:succinoglycan biosynthesis protein ExoA